MTSFYDVAMENRDIVVRLRGDAFDRAAVIKFLDYLELESIRQRSQMTQAQADALAEEVKQAGWQNLKESFLKT